MALLRLVSIPLFVTLLLAGSAVAGWSGDPFAPEVVVQASEPVELVDAVTDERGGMIVVFSVGTRGLSPELRAQRFDALAAPVWGDEGILVASDAEALETLQVIADGVGGAVLAWSRDDGASPVDRNVYAQRIAPDGSLAWASGGEAIAVQPNEQTDPVLAADGTGGAYIAWLDFRNSSTTGAAYVQRLDANGQAIFQADGLEVGLATGLEDVRVLFDDMGGVRVFWRVSATVRFQHLDGSGVPLLGSSLALNYDAPLYQQFQGGRLWNVVADGLGGFWWAGKVTSPSTDVAVLLYRPDNSRVQLSPLVISQSGSNISSKLELSVSVDRDLSVRYRNGFQTGAWVGAQRVERQSLTFDPQEMLFQTSFASLGDDDSVPDGSGGHWFAAGMASPVVTDDDIRVVRRLADNTFVDVGVVATDVLGSVVCTVADAENGVLIAFAGRDGFSVLATRVDRSGDLGHPRATLISVDDVPGDQGGQVLATWKASALDVFPQQRVTSYAVWRRASSGLARVAVADAVDAALTMGFETDQAVVLARAGFEPVGSVPAVYQAEYSFAVPTYADSTIVDDAPIDVQVFAMTASPFEFWASNVLTGRSIDDLAPGAPSNLMVDVEASHASLDWDASPAPDLAFYRVYRATTPDFEVDASNLVAEVAETEWVDSQGGFGSFYRIVAVDDAWNTSEDIGAAQVTDAPSPGLTRIELWPNVPNPFNPKTTIAYSLERTETVDLRVFDVSGRLVRVLVQGERRPAGRHEVIWDGEDVDGRRVASGTYFYEMKAGEHRRTRTMTLIK